jgi:hypothetical protein
MGAAFSAWRATAARVRQLSVAAKRIEARRTRLQTSKAFLGWLVEKRRKQEEDHKVCVSSYMAWDHGIFSTTHVSSASTHH